ncbi:zinc knuckle, partial [Ostertagia ostertagi]
MDSNQNNDSNPQPNGEVTLSRADFEELLARSTTQSAPTVPAPTAPAAAPQRISREEIDAMLAKPATRTDPVVPTAAVTLAPVAGSSTTPTFTKANLQKQFEFNTEILRMITPIAEIAPPEMGVQATLIQAITALTQRNELLVVADKDPTVWEFFDRHSKAQKFEVSNSILAEFLKMDKKVEKKETVKKTSWTRPHPYAAKGYQPFRQGGATWALAPPSSAYSPYFNRGRGRGQMGSSVSKFSQGSRLERPMCFECGAFGHLRAQCQAKQGSQPELGFIKDNATSAYQYADFVDSEISKLVHSKAIQEVEDHGNLRINPISVAVGKKLRLILDLSCLNKKLHKSKVKFEDVAKVLPLLPQGGYMASFDFKSGYHHVKMHPDFTRFLGFEWRQKYFKFLVLPFGLAPAPFVFTKTFRPLLRKWREKGLSVALYLDDGLIWAKSAQLCEEYVNIIKRDLNSAGVSCAEEKCNWTPTQRITWLGHEIDLNNFTLDVTAERREKTRALAMKLLKSRGTSLLDRFKWLGHIASMYLVIPSDLKRKWKTIVTQVARMQTEQCALSFRWKLSGEERSLLARKSRVESMRFQVNQPSGGILPISVDPLPASRFAAASSTARLAEERGLGEVAQVIQTCIDQSVAPGTLRIYKRVKSRFLKFSKSLRVPASELAKLRNIFIAQLIQEGQDRSLGYHVSALSHFFGPLPEDDADILKALLRAAARSRAPVKHRIKASKEDVDRIIELGLNNSSPAYVSAATSVMLAFSALLRVGE